MNAGALGTGSNALLALGSDGGPGGRAVSALAELGPGLAGAVRRSIPFLTRQGVAVAPSAPEPMSISDIQKKLTKPYWVAWFATDPGGARVAVFLDAGAVNYVLDGVLGGGSESASPPSGGNKSTSERLSAAQRALVTRVMEPVLDDMSSVFRKQAGFKIVRLPGDPSEASEASYVAVALNIGGDKSRGAVIVLVNRDALLAGSGPTESLAPKKASIDERVLQTLEDAELELIAELGRVKLTLGELSELQVGDTLRLDVPVNGVVTLRAEDQTLLAGIPTTSGSQIAIRLVATHHPDELANMMPPSNHAAS